MTYFRAPISSIVSRVRLECRNSLQAACLLHLRSSSKSVTRVRLTIRGPFFHTRTHDFLSRGALFFSQKVQTVF